MINVIICMTANDSTFAQHFEGLGGSAAVHIDVFEIDYWQLKVPQGFLGGLGPAYGVSELRPKADSRAPPPAFPAACSLPTPSGSAGARVCTLRMVSAWFPV